MNSKKILFIYYQNIKPNGVSKVLANLTWELVEKGHDIEILFLMAPHDDFYSIHPKIKKHYIDSFDNKYSKIGTKIIKQYSHLPKAYNIHSYFYDYGSHQVLDEWIENNHQHYVTIVSCWYKLSSMLSLNRKVSKKTIAWEHMSHFSGGYFWKNLLRKHFRNLKAVVGTYKKGSEYYRPINPNYLTIYNLMDDYCETVPFFPPDEKENIISVVARLDPEKNLLAFLEIIKNTNFTKPWKIKIVGNGRQKAELENYIAENNLTERVELLGSKNIDEVYELIKKSKINCLTSEAEALPTILIQAMFSSNALVAYDCNFGPADIISEKNGFLIPMNDQKLFKEKLELLDQNETLLNQLMQSSYEQSEQWKKGEIINQWEKIL